MVRYVCYTSFIEPKNVKEAFSDEFWVIAMQEELEQFVRNDVWTLVPRPKDSSVIGTKWVFKNKTDTAGKITKNKVRLVVQDYCRHLILPETSWIKCTKKKKTCCGEEKSGSRRLSRGSVSSLQLQAYFQPTKLHNLDFFTYW